MQRMLTPELMDDPAVPRRELEQSLRYIRAVNRRLSGTHALLHHLRRWTRDWPRGKPVTLLDIGTGSADIPVAVRTWGRRRTPPLDVRITGVDIHDLTLDLAREHVLEHLSRTGDDPSAVTLLRADARRLAEHFPTRAFHFVHAGLFLHHLPDFEVLTVLAIMDKLASRGIVWNDLVRARWAAAAVHLILIGQPHIVRHDARASVRAGFTKHEVLDFARRAGIGNPSYRTFLFHRFTLTGEKPP